jgi:hypothetical protein
MQLWVAAGIGFLIAGVLEVFFLGLCLMGAIFGGVASIATLMGDLRGVEAWLGPVLFVFYGLWFVALLVATPLHLIAGGSILAGRRNRKLLWAATVGSLLPAVTFYCAPTSLIAGCIGLVAAITTKEE